MNKTGKRRLLKLADLLVKDTKNKKGIKFDLSTWARPSRKRRSSDFELSVDCGTTACAVGLACVSGAFKRSGLGYETNGLWTGDEFRIIPVFQHHRNFDAVERFFDISDFEAEFLFINYKYPKKLRKGAKGERAVAKRIREFVAGKVQAPAPA